MCSNHACGIGNTMSAWLVTAEKPGSWRKFNPDVNVSDVLLPHMSGIELLAARVAEDADRHLILISAEANCDLAVEGMKQGPFTALPKPLEYPRLREILATIELARLRAQEDINGNETAVFSEAPKRAEAQCARR